MVRFSRITSPVYYLFLLRTRITAAALLGAAIRAARAHRAHLSTTRSRQLPASVIPTRATPTPRPAFREHDNVQITTNHSLLVVCRECSVIHGRETRVDTRSNYVPAGGYQGHVQEPDER